MKKMMIAAVAAMVLPLLGAGLKLDIDGRADKVTMKSSSEAGMIKGVPAKWAKELADCYLIYTDSVGSEEKNFKVQFTPEKSGTVNVCFRSNFYHKQKAQWIAYYDIKVTGAVIVNSDLKEVKDGMPANWRSNNRKNVGFIIGKNGKNALAGSHNANWYQPVKVTAGTTVTIEFTARFDRDTPEQSYNSNDK